MTITEATRRLGIRHPIVQGPFGGGLSSVALTATVSEHGGLGSYGAQTMSPEQIVGIAADIRARTDRPFALNLWVSDHDPGGFDRDPAQLAALRELFAPYFAELGLEVPELPERAFHPFEQQVEALLEARPHVFSFVFGVPRPAILEACRQRGIVTLGAATSIAEARALDEAGVELVVASGSEAGGHRPSFLA
ncbi:MAG: nitronate monooxygenase, partial [Deltaproteobacteria bacterium]|nr:nitronate monooxygenase [Nannocystaceae bacterium]